MREIKNKFFSFIGSPLLYQTIFVLIFLCFILTHDGRDWFFAQRKGCILFISLCAAICFLRKLRITLVITMAYCLFSALYFPLTRSNHFSNDPLISIVIHRSMLIGTISVLMAFLIAVFSPIPKRYFETCYLALIPVLVIHKLFLRSYFAPDGILMTPTLEATLVGLMVPMAFARGGKFKWIGWSCVSAVLILGGRTGIIELGAIASGYALFNPSKKFLFAFIGIAVIYFGLLHHLPYVYSHVDDKGRFEIWRFVWNWISHSDSKLFGMGAGSAYILVPALQGAPAPGTQKMLFMFLHNEPLTCLLELGRVGFSLIALCFFQGLILSYMNRDLRQFCFLFAMLAGSLTMFPWRHDTLMFFCVLETCAIFSTTLELQSKQIHI